MDSLVGFHFSRYFTSIHHNLSVENFLVDTFVKVVGHSLCFVMREASYHCIAVGSQDFIRPGSNE